MCLLKEESLSDHLYVVLEDNLIQESVKDTRLLAHTYTHKHITYTTSLCYYSKKCYE